MCHKHAIRKPRTPMTRQSGLSIISALFMLLLMAALGAFILTFSVVQHVTQAQDIQGSRAYWAANAGIAWGAYRVVTDNACASATLTVEGFTVTVGCSSSAYTEGSSTVNIYSITSTASEGTFGSAGYVERQLQATVGK